MSALKRLGGAGATAVLAWAAVAGVGTADAAAIRLREVAAEWGLDFRHHHGGSGRRYMVETMSGGVALFDYDFDGDDDVLFIDGGALPGYEGEAARSTLLRNDGGGRFVDVTVEARIEPEVYGNGATAGDCDGDGDLDLYVVNYVAFDFDVHQDCVDPANDLSIYCQPSTYPGVPDRFYRNRGDCVFEDATAASGFDVVEDMAGLGLSFGDLNDDGWPDLYVANDTEPNFLFLSRGDGRLEEEGMLSGTAMGERGNSEAGMGVGLGDLDGDGRLDIVVTNFERESNALYRNQGDGFFIDSRYPTRIAEPSFLPLAFGVVLADLDHDADLDLAVANGHVRDNAEAFREQSKYGQRNQIFENLGNGVFREVRDGGLELERVSRALAAADLDGDGDLDLVAVNSNQTAEVYQNLTTADGWLRIDLAGSESNTWGVDARIETRAGERRQLREVRTGVSYQSQSHLGAHFGLGASRRVDEVLVRWPSGKRQRFLALPASRRVRLDE